MSEILELYPVWVANWDTTREMQVSDFLHLELNEHISKQLEGENAIIALQTLPDHVKLMVVRGHVSQVMDRYSNHPIRLAFARDLKKLAVGPNASPRNYALKTYINALPDDLAVVLNWR